MHAPHQPHTWWRFIDHIFMIWTHTENDLLNFISYLNNHHPTIKFTSFHSSISISFLDLRVSQFGVVETDLYTDKHQYLLHSSCHPFHTKRAIHLASPSDYDAYVLLTRLLHYELMILSNTLTTVATISHSSNTRSNAFRNAFMLSHAKRHSNPVRPHPTNPVAFLLSSHTTLFFGLHLLSYKNTSVFYLFHHVVPAYLHLYLLLLFDGRFRRFLCFVRWPFLKFKVIVTLCDCVVVSHSKIKRSTAWPTSLEHLCVLVHNKVLFRILYAN